LNILLDTQCWLWSYFEPERLNRKAVKVLEEIENDLYFSVASSWEISIKYQLGKLRLPSLPGDFISAQLQQDQIRVLPIENRHAFLVAQLPNYHTDPFDRMLIAQAQVESMVLLTADPKILRYGVETLWAAL
jgi:PIN domain nuclease of toxin-antitoxin system